MKRFMPLGDQSTSLINHGNVDLSLSGDLASRVLKKSVPTPTADELTRVDVSTTQLTVDAAIALNIPIGEISAKYSRRVFIQEYIKFTDIEDGEQKVRYGVGIRWVLNVQLGEGGAKMTSIPIIAASVEMGYAQATALFQVIGLSSPKIDAAIAAPSRLTLDSYYEMNQSFLDIKALVNDPGTKISPQILAVLGEAKDDQDSVYEDALAAGWALSQIHDQNTLAEALDIAKTDRFKETVKSVYLDITGTTQLDRTPTDEASQRAESILGELEVDD